MEQETNRSREGIKSTYPAMSMVVPFGDEAVTLISCSLSLIRPPSLRKKDYSPATLMRTNIRRNSMLRWMQKLH